jgi:formylglycine-generating enzyme required for sulfatase activity
MVKVKGGSFTMNMEYLLWKKYVLFQDSTMTVTLPDYSIGQTEVTQALWLAVMGNNPSLFSSSNEDFMNALDSLGINPEYADDLNRPVEWVTDSECETFIARLNELTGRNFRLPTEAEWEFAASGGNRGHGYQYAGSDSFDEVAWCNENSDQMTHPIDGFMTHPVGQKKPNELGLYDMSGNVMEWCDSYVTLRWYEGMHLETAFLRITRGGSWARDSDYCKVSYRSGDYPGTRANFIGLRLAMW